MTFEPSEIVGAKILIVDDQSANVQLLQQLLVEEGYERVSSTMNPHEVCALQRANDYDLILLDLLMPDMDGFEVMAALRMDEAESYIPVIVITAQPDHKVRALQCGAKDFISKPFDLVEVKTRIHNMLEVRLLYKKLQDYNKKLEEEVQERTAALRESEARYLALTELACDWFWEQDENGNFTKAGGPVLEMLAVSDKGSSNDAGEAVGGWDEVARRELKAKIAARQPFLDFVLGRVDGDGTRQRYQISGQPIFDCYCAYVGYRGVGVELAALKAQRATARRRPRLPRDN
jgi:DNA-binding response OmpR family regulator